MMLFKFVVAMVLTGIVAYYIDQYSSIFSWVFTISMGFLYAHYFPYDVETIRHKLGIRFKGDKL